MRLHGFPKSERFCVGVSPSSQNLSLGCIAGSHHYRGCRRGGCEAKKDNRESSFYTGFLPSALVNPALPDSKDGLEGERRGGPKEGKKRSTLGRQGRLVVAIRGVKQPSVWPFQSVALLSPKKDKRRLRRSPWTTHPLPIRKIEATGTMGQSRHKSRGTQPARAYPSFSLCWRMPPIED